MNRDIRLTLISGLASVIASTIALYLSQDARLLWIIPVAIAVLTGIAALTRIKRPRIFLGPALHILALIIFVLVGWNWASGSLAGDWQDRWYQTAISTMRFLFESSPPLAKDNATLILLTALVMLTAIMVDLFFVTGRSVSLAALPLIVLYAIIVFLVNTTLNPLIFASLVSAWLLMAATSHFDHIQHWVRGTTHQHKRSLGTVIGALVIALASIAASLAGGLLVPANSSPRWQNATGRHASLLDPTIELEHNLTRPQDSDIINYHSDYDQPQYLRAAAMSVMKANGWEMADDQLLDKPYQVTGLEISSADTLTKIAILNFETNYLPAPYAPVNWDASGDWGYLPDSATIVNTARFGQPNTSGMQYNVESVNVTPTAIQIADANAGRPPDAAISSDIPSDIPGEIINLARTLTADQPTDGLKAMVLQDYLRNNYRYTIEAPDGTGYQQISNFLFESKAGYCIHYSAAMALMARILGIPSRVVTGFTPGEAEVDGSYTISVHDAHAWPELFFQDLGWVRFEPTAAIIDPPDYTLEPQAPQSASPDIASASPSATQAPAPTLTPQLPADIEQPQLPDESNISSSSNSWLWIILGLVVFSSLVLAPFLVRIYLKARRLTDPVGAWQELRALALDYHLALPPDTIANTKARLAEHFSEAADSDEFISALTRIADNAQQTKFAAVKPEVTKEQLKTDLAVLDRGFAETVSKAKRLTLKLWPRSIWHRI